jgi:hypothetical protein
MPLNAIRDDDVSGIYGIDDLMPVLVALAKGHTVTECTRTS